MKNLKYLLPLITAITLFTSCSKEYVIPEPIEVVDPNEPIDSVYYSVDIQPFFDAKCNSSCHNPAMLDLRSSASYNELIAGGYIDIALPTNSLLYTKINTGGSMNSFGVTSTEITNVRKWIEQGALNN
jgi:hypothetical protein